VSTEAAADGEATRVDPADGDAADGEAPGVAAGEADDEVDGDGGTDGSEQPARASTTTIGTMVKKGGRGRMGASEMAFLSPCDSRLVEYVAVGLMLCRESAAAYFLEFGRLLPGVRPGEAGSA